MLGCARWSRVAVPVWVLVLAVQPGHQRYAPFAQLFADELCAEA